MSSPATGTYLSINTEQTNPHPWRYKWSSVTRLEKQQSMFNYYLPAALWLAFTVTSSWYSHLCPFSSHLDSPFTHLGPSPKYFIISLAQSQKSLFLHPIMTPSQGEGISAVIQPAIFINLSGEFHPWSQGWSFSFDSPRCRSGFFPGAHPVTWSFTSSHCSHAPGNEPLITPHTACAKTLFWVISLHYQHSLTV